MTKLKTRRMRPNLDSRNVLQKFKPKSSRKSRKMQLRLKLKRRLLERLKKSVSLKKQKSHARTLKKLRELLTSLKTTLKRIRLHGKNTSKTLNSSSHRLFYVSQTKLLDPAALNQLRVMRQSRSKRMLMLLRNLQLKVRMKLLKVVKKTSQK